MKNLKENNQCVMELKHASGRVIEVQRENYQILSEYGIVSGKLKGVFYKEKEEVSYPVVGDYVQFLYNPHGVSLIEKVNERTSCFSRTDFSGHLAGYVKTIKEQVLAANFDYVFILSSLNHDFNENRIMRYLSTAIKSHGKPVVILTKADQCEDCEIYIQKVKALYPQVIVFAISAVTGQGMEQLTQFIQPGKTIVCLGSSGVGKSTLVNAIAQEEIMTVSGIREDDSKGHHTTTHRQLIELPSGVYLIDTPGIRELGMWNVEEGIKDTFQDVIELMHQCRFGNCSHTKEPGCAVMRALEDGTLDKKRWKLYQSLSGENQWVKTKTRKN